MGEDGTPHRKGDKGPKMLSIYEGDTVHFLKVDENSGNMKELLNASINNANLYIHDEERSVVIGCFKDHSYHVEKGMALRKFYIYFESESQAQGFVDVYTMYQQMDNDNRSDDGSEPPFDEGLGTQQWPDDIVVNLDDRKALASSRSSGTSNSSSLEPVEFGIGGNAASSSSTVSRQLESGPINNDDLSQRLKALDAMF